MILFCLQVDFITPLCKESSYFSRDVGSGMCKILILSALVIWVFTCEHDLTVKLLSRHTFSNSLNVKTTVYCLDKSNNEGDSSRVETSLNYFGLVVFTHSS